MEGGGDRYLIGSHVTSGYKPKLFFFLNLLLIYLFKLVPGELSKKKVQLCVERVEKKKVTTPPYALSKTKKKKEGDTQSTILPLSCFYLTGVVSPIWTKSQEKKKRGNDFNLVQSEIWLCCCWAISEISQQGRAFNRRRRFPNGVAL